MKTPNDIEKIYELSLIWREAKYNFAFWDKLDIDWDDEYKNALISILEQETLYDYYRELKRFINLLNDGHTDVGFPGEIMQDTEYFSMLPIYLAKVGEEFIVVATSETLKDEIPMFSSLVKIDGTDINDYIKEKCYPYIWHANEDACGMAVAGDIVFGKKGSKNLYTFSKDGTDFEIILEKVEPSGIKWREMGANSQSLVETRQIGKSETCEIGITDDGIAIIKMTSFADDTMPQMIYSCFDELKDAKGYILDVRGNSGGNSSNSDAIAAMFIEGEFYSCFAESQIYEPTYKAWSMFREDFKGLAVDEALQKYADDQYSLKSYCMQKNIYYVKDEGEEATHNVPGKLSGPIVVLMNQYTFSAAEDFVDVMKKYTDAVFVGNNTAGSSGQPLVVGLESGGFFRICTRRCIAQNGEDIYNKGFAPDVKIIPSVKDVISGHDVVLENALDIIKNRTT